MPSFVIVKDILKKKRINKVKIRDMKNFFKETFSKDLDERKSLDLLKRNSVDEMFKEFQNKFVVLADKNAPKKTLSKLEKKLKEKSWVTKSILQCIKRKNKYRNNYIKYFGLNNISFNDSLKTLKNMEQNKWINY